MPARLEASLDVSPAVARDATAGFFLLLVTIAGHVMVETARDTLFLTDLPASRLPWAYLAIALLALGVARASRYAAIRFLRRRVLSWTSILGAAVTTAFWLLLLERPRPEITFALYVWTGLLVTAFTIQFWIVLGDRMAPGVAKRTFAFIALGGLIGGLSGSVAASWWVASWHPRHLLLIAAGIFIVASAIPGFLSRLPERDAASLRRKLSQQPTRGALSDRYVRFLLVLALVTAIATTGIDFLFKSLAQSTVPKESLGSFFARFYAVVNLLALITQLFATRPLLQLFGPGGTLAALPSIGALGAAATGMMAGIVPIAMLKGADGMLRHSLHRTSTEVLFVPLPGNVRDPARSLAGSVGHRGGQALGSVLILGALGMNLEAPQVAAVLSVLCLVWFLAVRRIRKHYGQQVERRSQRPGSIAQSEQVAD